jgi:hypothetical protein
MFRSNHNLRNPSSPGPLTGARLLIPPSERGPPVAYLDAHRVSDGTRLDAHHEAARARTTRVRRGRQCPAWTRATSPSAHHEARRRARRALPGRSPRTPSAHHAARVRRCPPGRSPRAPALTARPSTTRRVSDGARLDAHHEPQRSPRGPYRRARPGRALQGPALTARPASTCPPGRSPRAPVHHQARVRRVRRCLPGRSPRAPAPLGAHRRWPASGLPGCSPRGACRRGPRLACLDARHAHEARVRTTRRASTWPPLTA